MWDLEDFSIESNPLILGFYLSHLDSRKPTPTSPSFSKPKVGSLFRVRSSTLTRSVGGESKFRSHPDKLAEERQITYPKTDQLAHDKNRSGTPLIYRAIPAWFVRVQPIVDQLVQNNKQTRWSVHSPCSKSNAFFSSKAYTLSSGSRLLWVRTDSRLGSPTPEIGTSPGIDIGVHHYRSGSAMTLKRCGFSMSLLIIYGRSTESSHGVFGVELIANLCWLD